MSRSPHEVAQAIVKLLFSEKPIVEQAQDEMRQNRDVQSYRHILTAMIEGEIKRTYIDF